MPPLLIIGASTRAAAFSAIRAGFDPICGDMYADADLRSCATVLDVPDYPHHLTDAVRHLSADIPWIYTGALENSPAIIERISVRHRLWGNAAASLKLCRDPWFCRDILRQAGLPALDLRASDSPPPRDGQWLLKPLRSAAGRAITVWGTAAERLTESHYFQQFVPGIPLSAAFLGGRDSVELCGVSQQLIGKPDLHAPPFGYCGSIFPWRELSATRDSTARERSRSDQRWEEQILQIGGVVGRECGLRGLFGIDLICDGRTIWLIEVNPRYTASMELIEYWSGQPLLDWQQRMCEQPENIRRPEFTRQCPAEFCGKVILYANRHTRAPDLSHWIPSSISVDQLPGLADIPLPGTEIWPGQPVFTCLGTGPDPDSLLQELTDRANDLWAKFPTLF